MAQGRVHWKYEEKERLVKYSARLVFAGQVESPVQGLRAAQAVLSEDRRRDAVQLIESKNEWFRPWFDEELRKLRADAVVKAKEELEAKAKQQASDAKKAAEAAAEQAPPAQPTPSPIAQPVAQETPRHLNGAPVNGSSHDGMNGAAATAEVPTPAATKFEHHFQSLRSLLVDELASVFVEAALKAMGSTQFGEQYVRIARADEADESMRPQPPQRIVFQRQSPTVRKPGVLIVGLKGGQKTEIQRDYGKHFDLRFV